MPRGRHLDPHLPLTRELVRQRDFRARKSARLLALEDEVDQLRHENQAMRKELQTLRDGASPQASCLDSETLVVAARYLDTALNMIRPPVLPATKHHDDRAQWPHANPCHESLLHSPRLLSSSSPSSPWEPSGTLSSYDNHPASESSEPSSSRRSITMYHEATKHSERPPTSHTRTVTVPPSLTPPTSQPTSLTSLKTQESMSSSPVPIVHGTLNPGGDQCCYGWVDCEQDDHNPDTQV
ncbi:hypothetical protein BCR39DRAFT_513179 [Naematelia encephala]|uniref:BZIP domain-containing protein n=1 Tax=Naematelia encephala TaxID=71784 RepID=A0A1Y2BME8_9TREE|nr:hypothetical protein BCR39DRAFT_513179 [Naematelia encephala]